MKTQAQSTSIAAYHDLKDLGQRQFEVYRVIEQYGPVCNLDISRFIRIAINSVTPRVKELRERGLVVAAYKDRSPTGRVAIYWQLNQGALTQERLFDGY